MMRIIALILSALFALSFFSCGGDDDTSPQVDACDSLIVKIDPEVLMRYPYKTGLKSLLFSDVEGNEYDFKVVALDTNAVIVTVLKEITSSRYTYRLFCEELDIHLTLELAGSANTLNCPDEVTFLNYLSITGPIENAPASQSGQSYNNISMFYEGRDITFPDPGLDSLNINNNIYRDVYEGVGALKIYFNFENGICSLVDNTKDLTLNIKQLVY